MQRRLDEWVRIDATRIAARVEERVRRFLEEYRPRFVYVMFSGGKDSAAALAAAMRVAPERVVAVYNVIAGQTHHANINAALGVARRLGLRIRRLAPKPGGLRLSLLREPPHPPEMIVVVATAYRMPGAGFWEAVRRWGFPAPAERFGRGLRWCCSEFKEKWWAELPASGVYEGRPARFLIVGVKASDSPYRARRWKQPVNVFAQSDVALAPLYDLKDHHVWSLLRHYGLYDIVREQYEVFGHSPNCTLCPLMSTEAFTRTIRALPEEYLERIASILAQLRNRYAPGTFSHTKIGEWLDAINAELGRRRLRA